MGIIRRAKLGASLGLLFILLSMVVGPVLADGTLTLDINIVAPESGPVPTGTIVEYLIDFSCASTTVTCGALTIDFQMDSEFILDPVTAVEVVAPPGYTGVHLGGGLVRITSNGTFNDGDAAQVTVRARVGQDLDDFRLDGTLTGTITNGPGGSEQTLNVPGPDLDIERPQGGWDVAKTQIIPAIPDPLAVDPPGPAPNGTATYQVSLCPNDPPLGVAELVGPLTITDVLPPGAVPVAPIPRGGCTIQTQTPTRAWC
ncbi:MAG: hypothetical protein HC915_14410 [Anaerolineae bacterium]|nr:hypothetical protein [Anaerolineae bacterium]